MITLVTGTPGSGKTLYVVWHEIRVACEQGRSVYSSGIPKLSLPVIPLSDAEIRQWHVTDPKLNPNDPDEVTKLSNIAEGSLVVIDEVQRLWRPAGSGAVVPADIAGLETHRHHGLDFVVICQHPSLLHRNVRALVGRHIHLRATALGNYLYEFPEWCENPQTKSARTSCVRSRYRLPKAGFNLYESASLHVKTDKRKPIQLFIVIAVLLAIPVLGYQFIRSVYFSGSKKNMPVSSGVTNSLSDKTTADSSQSSKDIQYLNVSSVSPQVDWSKISSCVKSASRCLCYGDSGERLAVPVSICQNAVEYGWGGRESKNLRNDTDVDRMNKSVDHSKPLVKKADESVETDGSRIREMHV
jgi:zona occludens toxin